MGRISRNDLFFAVAMLAVIQVLLVIAFGVSWDTLPHWFEAFGVIGTVIVALWQPLQARRIEEVQTRDAALGFLQLVRECLDAVVESADDNVDFFIYINNPSVRASLIVAQRSVDTLAIQRLHLPHLVGYWAELSAGLATLIEQIDNLRARERQDNFIEWASARADFAAFAEIAEDGYAGAYRILSGSGD